MDNESRTTALYPVHEKYSGKIVDFAGWALPVRFVGAVEEHHAVRQNAGLFDVSHMGEIVVRGPESLEALQRLTCNDVSKLYDGKAQYSALLNEQGGVIDDIIVYRRGAEDFLLCVNAANTEVDYQWLCKKNSHKCEIENHSQRYAQIALQGPKSLLILNSMVDAENFQVPRYFHFANTVLCGSDCIVARTGYTGEDGVEFFISPDDAVDLWELLMETGREHGLMPCGLASRDTLRLEACYPLHGHELGTDITALESGLGWIVKFNKGDFIGKEALLEQKTQGVPRKLVGLRVNDRGIVREGAELRSESGDQIGFITSGTQTPTVGAALALALLDSSFAALKTSVWATVRSRRLECEVVPTPFYKRP